MKKILIIAAMAASITANAQKTCEERLTTEVDKMTDVASTYMKDVIITPEGNVTLMVGMRNTFCFSVYGIDKGCIDEHAEMIFLFEDGQRMTIYSDIGFNCSGRATAFIGGIFKKKDFWNAISTKKISAIRVKTRNLPAQLDLTPEQSDDIFETIKCFNWQY